jgi:hypothetical protein
MIGFSQDQLLGKVLTVVDAALPEGSQREAIKDLLKGHFYHEYPELKESIARASINCMTHKTEEELNHYALKVHRLRWD